MPDPVDELTERLVAASAAARRAERERDALAATLRQHGVPEHEVGAFAGAGRGWVRGAVSRDHARMAGRQPTLDDVT